MSKSLRSHLLSAVFLGLLATGCASDISARGNLPKPEKLAEVKLGASKDEILQALGSPTSVGTFNDKVWYYVGQRTEEYAFYKPEVLERTVIALTFDDESRVADIKMLGKDDGRQIEMVERTTPGVSRDLNLLQQLFSNLGKSPALPGVTGGSGSDSGL